VQVESPAPVAAAAASQPAATAPSTAQAAAQPEADYEDIEISNIRKVIAKRLLFSKVCHTILQYRTLSNILSYVDKKSGQILKLDNFIKG
jgi:hypothetical protein